MEKTITREPGRELFIASLLLDRNKLTRSESVEAEVNSLAIRYGLRSPIKERQVYAVAIVRCEEKDKAYRNLAEMQPVGEGIFGKRYRCGCICTGGKLIYLINGSPEGMKSQLNILAGELAKNIERTMHTRCSVGISKFKTSILDCDKAYDEAAFVFRYLTDKAGGVYYMEDVLSTIELDFSLLSYRLTAFEGLLKVGDRNDMEKFLDDIFSEDKLKNVSNANIDILCQQMLFCIRKGLYDVQNSPEAERFLALQLGTPIINTDKDEVKRIALEAKDIMSSQRKQNSELLCDGAMHIIETEYADETLSLVSISERLHVSSSYLSAILRKNRGDTFVNLLTAKRMAAAKELLKCTSMKIMEVAKRCGYSDQHYFSYCFKRYYGISPNKIRKSRADYELDLINDSQG